MAAGGPTASLLMRVGLCLDVPGGGVCEGKCMEIGGVVLPVVVGTCDVISPEL